MSKDSKIYDLRLITRIIPNTVTIIQQDTFSVTILKHSVILMIVIISSTLLTDFCQSEIFYNFISSLK